ncbi:hypothetical protein A3F37_00435 [Candidatus Saccharibacteria bacterium RIFCSPHIGHO2_12_FULL_41_12]|nr:MAG: hypothetical protein A3F37_00435 [Candidatus Saccharibacteria bacterium RIFCSPHIGHO2_12_FULL_41_12]
MAKSLVLVSNPGSASRKYALYDGNVCRARLHFEYDRGHVICTIIEDQDRKTVQTDLQDIADAPSATVTLLNEHNLLVDDEQVDSVGLRIVAPSSYFLEDKELTHEVVGKLEQLKMYAPLHITASLQELYKLREHFAHAKMYGVSDSAFHHTKPDRAWNYGLPLEDADRLDIKRFGYHGLAVESAIHQLRGVEKLTPKVVVVHLGSGDSVSAVYHGKSVDNTMGYSPLEGPIMSTRSGSLDISAAQVLQAELGFSNDQLDEYLNHSCGLLGLGGSSDIRELLSREELGNHQARLALDTYIYGIQKAIGSMSATLGGIDQLVFTGTVGERSATIRKRIVHSLAYLDLVLDSATNKQCFDPKELTLISRLTHSKPIHVVPIDEDAEIAHHLHVVTAM